MLVTGYLNPYLISGPNVSYGHNSCITVNLPIMAVTTILAVMTIMAAMTIMGVISKSFLGSLLPQYVVLCVRLCVISQFF